MEVYNDVDQLQTFWQQFSELTQEGFLRVEGTATCSPAIFDYENYGGIGDEWFHRGTIFCNIAYSDLFVDEVFEKEEWVNYKNVYYLKIVLDNGIRKSRRKYSEY